MSPCIVRSHSRVVLSQCLVLPELVLSQGIVKLRPITFRRIVTFHTAGSRVVARSRLVLFGPVALSSVVGSRKVWSQCQVLPCQVLFRRNVKYGIV